MLCHEIREFTEDDERVLREYIVTALRLLYSNDMHLISTGEMNAEEHCSERSIVFRFSQYLQQFLNADEYFKYYNLDCEYNRNKKGVKKTRRFPNGTYPDVILHMRGSNEHNVLIIEFKGHWNPCMRKDIKKIEDFTSPDQDYKFNLGLAILLGKEIDEVMIHVIKDGEKKCECNGLDEFYSYDK